MMKKIQFSLILLSVAALSHAESSTPSLVVVQLQEVGQKSLSFKSVQQEIEKKINSRIDDVKKLDAEFSQKLEKLQNGAKDMNPSAQQKLQEDLASLKAQLEVKQRKLQEFIETEMRAAEEKLIKQVQDVCKRLGYDIVIPGALYTKDAYDRTKEVIAEMDKSVATKTQTSTLKRLENEVDAAAHNLKSRM